jgi:SAM-dependent methyltransferase
MKKGKAEERDELLRRTDEYNAAAEIYFSRVTNTDFLMMKPFSDAEETARHLVDVGVLMQAMRLRPGDVVAEVGAGSCWLSHMLNLFGCRTIAIDVSPTAIAIGRRLFETDARTNWTLDPQFLAYDGHALPVASASCDRVLVKDAFHHIPNQREILREMRRILRPDGVLAMCEPGLGHASAKSSQDESATGVLENELDLSDLAALAEACGFEAVKVVVANRGEPYEIDARNLGAFMGGKGVARYWTRLCSSLTHHHYLVCYKGSDLKTTRRPGVLSAHITLLSSEVVPTPGAEAQRVRIRVANLGDTHWIANAGAGGGWTRVGVHLQRAGAELQSLDFDWLRFALPRDVAPGSQVEMELVMPHPRPDGDYVATIDLVVEGLTWFASRGSHALDIALSARAPAS